MTPSDLWNRYQTWLCAVPAVGLTLDISRMDFPEGFMDDVEGSMQRAYAAMDALEGGAIANPDEQRMVGHYWLRSPELAPEAQIRSEIESTLRQIHDFA